MLDYSSSAFQKLDIYIYYIPPPLTVHFSMTRSVRYQPILHTLYYTLHTEHAYCLSYRYLNNVDITTVIEMVEIVGILDGRLGQRSVERVRYVINNLLHLVIVKYGDISLVLCISTRLRLVTILSLLVKYLVIFHADPCNKSYIHVYIFLYLGPNFVLFVCNLFYFVLFLLHTLPKVLCCCYIYFLLRMSWDVWFFVMDAQIKSKNFGETLTIKVDSNLFKSKLWNRLQKQYSITSPSSVEDFQVPS